MSEFDENPEDFVAPGPEVAGGEAVLRIGRYNYIFERFGNALIYRSRTPAAEIPDDEDDEPFDPSQYR